jgi:hypothetical protein
MLRVSRVVSWRSFKDRTVLTIMLQDKCTQCLLIWIAKILNLDEILEI